MYCVAFRLGFLITLNCVELWFDELTTSGVILFEIAK